MRKINITILTVLLAVGFNITTSHAEESQSNLDLVYKTLEFTQADKDVTARLRDGTEGIHENGFYWMMKKISALPKLNAQEYRQLDSPAYPNLLRMPDRYRYMPLRMTVCVYTVQEMTIANRYLSPSPFWNAEKPIYRIQATVVNDSGKSDFQQPLTLFSQTPPPNLPTKFEEGERNTKEYSSGPIYEIAGIFLKYTVETDREGQIRQYPMILTWQMAKIRSGFQKSALNRMIGMIVILVLVFFAAVYIFVRRKTKSARHPISHKELFARKTLAEGDDDGEIVDPSSAVPTELAEAAKQYRKEHGLDEENRKDFK